MIDLHCHILPGVDDGARNLEESLSMARVAVQDGIHTIVTTPHTLNGVYLNPAREIRSKVANLKDALTKHKINLQLCEGADIHLCPHVLEHIQRGEAGTINGNGRYVLLELPSQAVPRGVKDEIFSLKLNGITPIITHPERHSAIQRNPDILYDLVCAGAFCQITAMSITGEFGEMVMHFTEMLLIHRLAHVIASDAHSPESRPPVLSMAVEVAAEITGSYEEAESMVTHVPASILAGEMIEVPEPRRIG